MTSRVLFAITLALTLTVPLQWAIIGGAVLSMMAFIVSAGSRVELVRAVRDEQGWRLDGVMPAALPTDEPLLLAYRGPNFFADVAAISDRIPAPVAGSPGVLVLDLGALERFSSTTLKSLGKLHATFAAAGSDIVLAGVGEDARETLRRTALLTVFGEENVLPADVHLGGSLDAGLERGRTVLAGLRGA